MPVLPKYADLRSLFAVSASPADPDGFPPWPVANLRASGFSSTLILTTTGGHAFSGSPIGPLIDTVPAADAGFPFSLTCNAGAADAVYGTQEYDWYLSQRVDAERLPTTDGTPSDTDAPQYFTLVQSSYGYSGTVTLDIVDSEVAKLLPGLSGADLVTADSLSVLLKNVHIYCQRRSDKAIQWAKLY